MPLLEGCSARFECRVAYKYDGGDHVIFVGEVINFDDFSRPPLIFHGGNYGLLLKKENDIADGSSSFGDDWLGFLLGRAYYQLLMPVKQNLKDKGLRDIDYNILTVLSMGEGRTVAEVAQLVALAGHQVGEADIHKLIGHGLVVLEEGEAKEAVVRFTEEGRHYAMELLAVRQIGRRRCRARARLSRGPGAQAAAQARDPLDRARDSRPLAQGKLLAREQHLARRDFGRLS